MYDFISGGYRPEKSDIPPKCPHIKVVQPSKNITIIVQNLKVNIKKESG